MVCIPVEHHVNIFVHGSRHRVTVLFQQRGTDGPEIGIQIHRIAPKHIILHQQRLDLRIHAIDALLKRFRIDGCCKATRENAVTVNHKGGQHEKVCVCVIGEVFIDQPLQRIVGGGHFQCNANIRVRCHEFRDNVGNSRIAICPNAERDLVSTFRVRRRVIEEQPRRGLDHKCIVPHPGISNKAEVVERHGLDDLKIVLIAHERRSGQEIVGVAFFDIEDATVIIVRKLRDNFHLIGITGDKGYELARILIHGQQLIRLIRCYFSNLGYVKIYVCPCASIRRETIEFICLKILGIGCQHIQIPAHHDRILKSDILRPAILAFRVKAGHVKLRGELKGVVLHKIQRPIAQIQKIKRVSVTDQCQQAPIVLRDFGIVLKVYDSDRLRTRRSKDFNTTIFQQV